MFFSTLHKCLCHNVVFGIDIIIETVFMKEEPQTKSKTNTVCLFVKVNLRRFVSTEYEPVKNTIYESCRIRKHGRGKKQESKEMKKRKKESVVKMALLSVLCLCSLYRLTSPSISFAVI